MWNPFKKNKTGSGVPQMGMLQSLAMKKLQKMSPEERQKVMREAMKPENQEKIMKVMEQMKASGQITDEQIKLAKEKFGL